MNSKEAMREVQAGSDTSVQATASNAATGKMSAASLGYFEDRFLDVLAGDRMGGAPRRRLPPVMNRGNFARVSCIERLVLDFLAARSDSPGKGTDGEEQSDDSTDKLATQPAKKPQVISLGAGKDSLCFRLMDKRSSPSGGYFEVDFDAVATWKTRLIAKTPALSSLTSDLYHLLAADLRDVAALESALRGAGVDFAAPTIFLAECVLVYMEPESSAALLEWCSSRFPDSLFAAYEMTSPGDAFGQMMKQNIQGMGCLLPGLEPYPTLASQEKRFNMAGWDSARASDMLTVFQEFLDREEVRRISKIEILDEVEEWELIMRHYCLVVAAKGQDAIARLGAMPLAR